MDHNYKCMYRCSKSRDGSCFAARCIWRKVNTRFIPDAFQTLRFFCSGQSINADSSSSSSYFIRSRLVLRYMTTPARPILPLADPSCQEPIWETVAGCTFHNADPQKPYTLAYTDAYPISCCIPNTPMHTLYAKAHWGPLGSLLQSAMADCIHNMHQRNHSCPVEPKPPPHTSFNWQAAPHMSCSDNLWTGSTFFLFESTLAIFTCF